MQAFEFQNSKDSMKTAQISHLISQVDFEQQAHLLIMQAFAFQNSKNQTEIT